MNTSTKPPQLSDEQLREMESIDIESLLSAERIAELHSLIASGYPNSAILCAIREAAYAAKQSITIPPSAAYNGEYDIKQAAYALDPECWVSYSGKPREFKQAMERRRVASLAAAEGKYRR
jgi:hypothetical protein